MRFAPVSLLVAGSLASSQAFAGGVGLLFNGGMRTQTVYYYDSSADMAQFSQPQLVTSYGSGVEFVLGDRDDKIVGIFRGYWLQEGPERDPGATTTFVDPGNVVADWRDTPRNVGVGTFGVSWGVLGDPNKWQLTLISEAGSGFLTPDHTEYLILQGGPGFQYMIGDSVQLHAEAEYGVHFRKTMNHGPTAYLGVRYLFD